MDNTVRLLKSEGISGAQDLIFLTRYAALCSDKTLTASVGESLKQLIMPRNAWLSYALAEYYESTGEEFAKTACEYLLASEENAMARNKAARVFENEDYLIEDTNDPLALIELYKATYDEDALNKAIDMAAYIRDNFEKFFNPEDVYDFKEPSSNSCIAVLFDEIARITQERAWIAARERQNHFVKLLSEKYPTRVSFGLCALLADNFESKTFVIEGEVPRSLFSFYSPLTELVVKGGTGKTRVFLSEEGVLSEIDF